MIFALLTATLAFAQSPADLFSKAPPAVDQALRDRVTKFYQAHVDGKFRLADQFVAEDSKDIFFEADKRRCRSFAIVRIDYNDDFSKATVVINCATEVLLPPQGLTSVTMPLPSKWKLESAQWFWHVPQRNARDSAFGQMKPGDGGVAGSAIPSGPSVTDLQRMVSADRRTVRLSRSSRQFEEVLVTSTLPGTANISIAPIKIKDVTASLDKSQLIANQTAKLTIRFDPDPANPRHSATREDIVLKVEPTGQIIYITLEIN